MLRGEIIAAQGNDDGVANIKKRLAKSDPIMGCGDDLE
jgi:hypothetical protein